VIENLQALIQEWEEERDAEKRLEQARSIYGLLKQKTDSQAFKEDAILIDELAESFKTHKQTPEGVLFYQGRDEDTGIPVRSFEASYYLLYGQEVGIKSYHVWLLGMMEQFDMYIKETLEAMEEEQDNR
jgi:hypothetical protein